MHQTVVPKKYSSSCSRVVIHNVHTTWEMRKKRDKQKMIRERIRGSEGSMILRYIKEKCKGIVEEDFNQSCTFNPKHVDL